ncbi:MAG: hypothetical protein HY960_04900 [Ignavibacteriae bacterium]|nr:hypothetical protein [Ignavibacteriota bacterium]
MTEQEFRTRYSSEKQVYTAWGNYVLEQLNQHLTHKLGDKGKLDSFIKINPKPRTKEIDSLVAKAFYRNKNYNNPYEDITDKVGVRYVVLLIEDIEIIKGIIENTNMTWIYSKDRDFEEERLRNPLIFDYQSVHYILRSKENLSYNGIEIPQSTPCEVQIRTLLQHAYSELTHDLIYKPTSYKSPQVIRSVARSMALIETTDKIFSEVDMTLRNADENINKFFNALTQIYKCYETTDIEPKINIYILDAYRETINNTNIADIEAFISRHSYLANVIKRNLDLSFLYKQPIILFIYFMIEKQKNVFRNKWPLTESELRPMFTDMGISFDR